MPGNDQDPDLWVSEHITPWDVYQHGVTAVLLYRRTTYQKMLIVDTGGYGKALILDGKWQSSVCDEFLYHEPLVHPACVCQGGPRHVLILGGGEGATLREVLRWNTVERAVMVDIDKDVVEACRQHLPEMHKGAFDDPRAQLVIGDALDYVAATDHEFDVVIGDLSDPIEEGPSFKLFTREHFQQLRHALAPNGHFVLQAGPVGPDLKLHARLVNTLSTVYEHVVSYASYVPSFVSPWGFALASSVPINTRPEPEAIDRLLESRVGRKSLRMFDGTTFLGMMQMPRHVRRAIETENKVYTLAEPATIDNKGMVDK